MQLKLAVNLIEKSTKYFNIANTKKEIVQNELFPFLIHLFISD